MTHVILTAQTDLQRQLVPETVPVRDIQGMVLCQSVEIGVVLIQFLNMRTVGIVVMGVSRTVTPVARVVISCFQTALRRWFPFVVGLDLNTLLFT